MHEMSLAQSIVEIVERTAKENHSNKVVSVRLIVGKLSGVEMHSLMQSLKIASQSTVMEKAEIFVDRLPGTAWCMNCGKTVPMERLGDACPECGGYQLRVNGGKEFRVSEIELSDDEEN